MNLSYNPWDYLDYLNSFTNFYDVGEKYGYFFSSLYILFQTVGIFGAVCTSVIAAVQFIKANPNRRAELKDIFTHKFLVIIALFAASYVFGLILGIILSI